MRGIILINPSTSPPLVSRHFIMNPERWQQIDQLLQSALEQEPGQRSAFLAYACADDEPLRCEVESLIASHEKVGNILEKPLSQVAAQLFIDGEARLAEGQI